MRSICGIWNTPTILKKKPPRVSEISQTFYLTICEDAFSHFIAYLNAMEWWYKSEKFKVNNENSDLLEDGMKDVMRQGNSISTASLYKDADYFYIRTTNH